MKKRVSRNNFGNCLLFSFSPKERNNKCLKRFGFKTSLSLCCLYLHTFSSSLKSNVLCDNELFSPLRLVLSEHLRTIYLEASEVLVDLI